MTDTPLRFIPLNAVSQGSCENVFYYDSNVSLNGLYDGITYRLQASIRLLEAVHEIKNIPHNILLAISSVSNILLNDCCVLFEEFNPMALQLREDVLLTNQ